MLISTWIGFLVHYFFHLHRIFTFGIGSGASTALVNNGLAKAGRDRLFFGGTLLVACSLKSSI